MEELLAAKLENCKTRLGHMVPDQYREKWNALDVPQLKTAFTMAEAYWSAVDEKNEALFLALLEMADQNDLAIVISQAAPEDKELAWKYAQFFLQAMRESLA